MSPRRTHSSNLITAFICLTVLSLCVAACSDSGAEAASETIKRGDLTIETYAPQKGIGHGDGTPGGCRFSYKGTTYSTPPMVKNGGKMFRCDVKENSDEPVIRIGFYRPEDDWTCGTRFGAEKAKCLPDHYEPVGGILTIRNGELAFEEHGFWDVSYEWGEHSVKFHDGREFDYKTWKWSGCGPEPQTFVKSGPLTVSNGMFCNSDRWHRVFFNGKELRPEGAGDHPFDSVGVNQDASRPSATAWIGSVSGFAYLSDGKPVYKEVPNSPEFMEDGKVGKWWSEDHQTRYLMDLATEKITSQTRDEVGALLDKTSAEKNILKQAMPILTSDEFSKFEVDYKERHGQFYLGDLKKFDPLSDIGFYPYSGKKLMSAGGADSAYFLFTMHSVIETAKLDDPCIGRFVTSVIWVRTDLDMIARDAKSQVIDSCLLNRKMIGEPRIADGKLTAAFQDAAGRHELVYDNSKPGEKFSVR